MNKKRHYEKRVIRTKPDENLDPRTYDKDVFLRQLQNSDKLVSDAKNELIKVVKQHPQNLEKWISEIFLNLEKENRKHLAKAQFFAERDISTGLLNRFGFQNRILEYIKENEESILFFIDINNLKKINDLPTLGHKTGDLYLNSLAIALGHIGSKFNCTVSRIGGDEFAMFYVPQKKDTCKLFYDNMEHFLQGEFSEEWSKHNIAIPASFAVGRAKLSEINLSNKSTLEVYNILLDLADARMYKNKKKMKENKI